MNVKIFVTGGTGTLGSHVVPLLTAAGYDLRILSPAGDNLTLDGALVAPGSWEDFLAARLA